MEFQLYNTTGIQETDLLPDIHAKLTESGDIKLKTVISQLKHIGYMLFGASFSYYSNELSAYIFCAVDPVPPTVSIPRNDLVDNKLVLRAKIEQTLIIESSPKISKQHISKYNRTRAKERRIGQVIEQVGVWRKYYNGYADYQGKTIKLSLDEAAAKVGVPKKSLDDYYLQLRIGKLYGFDFNKHKDDTFGVLRAYIKIMKERDS